MSKVIWQYNLPNSNTEVSLSMPEHSEILNVCAGKDGLVLWALVDPENDICQRRFRSYVNCQTLIDEEHYYIASVQFYNVWWHVFELDMLPTNVIEYDAFDRMGVK